MLKVTPVALLAVQSSDRATDIARRLAATMCGEALATAFAPSLSLHFPRVIRYQTIVQISLCAAGSASERSMHPPGCHR